MVLLDLKHEDVGTAFVSTTVIIWPCQTGGGFDVRALSTNIEPKLHPMKASSSDIAQEQGFPKLICAEHCTLCN